MNFPEFTLDYSSSSLYTVNYSYCKTVFRLEVDFVLPLSQVQEEQEQEQPPPKSRRKMLTAGLKFGT